MVLHRLTDSHKADVARLLLEHGAQPGSPDLWGRSPIDYAWQSVNFEALRVLLEKIPTINNAPEDLDHAVVAYARMLYSFMKRSDPYVMRDIVGSDGIMKL